MKKNENRNLDHKTSIYLDPETFEFLDNVAKPKLGVRSRSAAIEKIIEFYRRMTDQ